MSLECEYRDVCEAGALFEEATIIAQVPDDVIKDLGWEAASRVVMNAAFDTLAELSDAELAEFRQELPSESSRCSDCYLKRNELLRMLLGNVPDGPADPNDH